MIIICINRSFLLQILFYFSYLDINECDAINGPSGRCGKNAICTNTPGGFSCQCKLGFSGNAFKQCIGKTLAWDKLLINNTY